MRLVCHRMQQQANVGRVSESLLLINFLFTRSVTTEPKFVRI
jgi:hypothetical protein